MISQKNSTSNNKKLNNHALNQKNLKRQVLKNSRIISSQTTRNRFEMVGVKLASPQKIRNGVKESYQVVKLLEKFENQIR